MRALLIAALLSAAPGLSLAGDYPFDNLPGVIDPKDKPQPQLNCTTSLRDGRDDAGVRSWRSGPVVERVYRCEENGVTVESLEPPRLYDWNVYKGADGIVRRP
jgi:hypothetical protein